MRRPRPENQKAGRYPEELTYVRTSDNVVDAGMRFSAPQQGSKEVAVIWVHGWGANFYMPSYVGIGRELAARGFVTFSVNTRMHDIGNVEKYTFFDKRVRGGGYWGVTSESSRDIAAWIDYAEQLGFKKVVLIGHSAGWASVARYAAETQDDRVSGVVLASGFVGAGRSADPQQIEQAKKLVDEGAGEDLLRLANTAFPSFISAATFLDTENTPSVYKDFFGIGGAQSPGITRLNCSMLAFFGSSGDIAGEKELKQAEAAIQKTGARTKITTLMIANAGHEYVGEEAQVAEKIAHWIKAEVLKVAVKN